jgi:hypothetical protein
VLLGLKILIILRLELYYTGIYLIV